MVHLEASSFEGPHIVGSHRQAKLESSLVSGVVEESSHQTGLLEDGPCPTKEDIHQ